MSCNNELTTGIALDCFSQVGGVEVAYVASFSGSIGGLTPASDSSTIALTSLTLDGTTVTDFATDFETFECERQTGVVTETGTFGGESNGTAFYTQVASTVFNKLASAKQETLKTLGKNKLCVIVKDNNGKYWLIGNDSGATVSNSTGTTGTAFGDANQLTIEFTGISLYPMYEVTVA